MAVRAASGTLRGVAQHGVTPLCIPLSLPSSHHHNISSELLDLPHPSSLSLTCHISWPVSAPAGTASCPKGLSSSMVTQGSGPSLLPRVSWSLPFPIFLLGVESLAVVLLPSSCHRNNSAGNNSPQKARTTQHLQATGLAGSSGFLQDLFPSSLFQLLSFASR